MSVNRPRPLVPAQVAFDARRAEFAPLDLRERFDLIFRTNLWSASTRSGLGSELAATAALRAALPPLIEALGARTMLDVPCGDFNWLSTVALDVDYTGADIVPALVEENTRRHGGPRRRFIAADLTADPLPAADLVLCRDCLVHLSFANIRRALDNLRRSGSRYLLTTTFLEHEVNTDIEDGDWRVLNLQRAPFNLPEPEMTLLEGCSEGDGAFADKALGLWRIADLP
ncbi:MAG TPA: class I SAM-dependent methyltransferase [Vicinamibacterales bacterium]